MRRSLTRCIRRSVISGSSGYGALKTQLYQLRVISLTILMVLGVIAQADRVAAAEIVYQPVDDTWVDDKRPAQNYGSEPALELRGQNRNDVNTYLKFSVSGSGGVVAGAFLRLFVERGGDDGGSIYSVSNEYANSPVTWTEAGLTWDNAPPILGVALDSAGPVTAGTWIELDVSQAITGDGTYSFALSSSTNG